MVFLIGIESTANLACGTRTDCLSPIHALKLSQANQPSFFFFLNHHIHAEDVNIHGVCGTHLCTEVTPPAWMRPYSSGNTDGMIAFVAKVNILCRILAFLWCA